MFARPAAKRERKAAVPWLALGSTLALTLLLSAFILRQWPSFGKVSYVYRGGKMETAELPLSVPTQGENLSVLVPLRLGLFHPALYRVKADDCLQDLFINDVRVPRERTDFCDYSKGRILNLAPYLRRGENLMQFNIRDHGGMGGVDIRPSPGDPLPLALSLTLFIGAAAALFLLRRPLGHWLLPTAVSAAAFSVHFLYWMGTTFTTRGYDTEGHVEYVQYVLNNARIPPASEGWEYYQPPLYYFFAALWGKAGAMLSLPLSGSLQLLSLFLSLLSAACIFWIGTALFDARRERWGFSLFLASSLLLPGMVFFTPRINNDVLALTLSLLCLGLLLRWWRKPERRGAWVGVSVVLSLGILTKSTTLPLVAAALLLLLLSPVPWKKKWFLGGLSLAVILLFTDWLFLYRFIFEGARGLVGNAGNLSSGLLLKNTVAGFVRFNPLFLLGHPYNNPWDDAYGRQYLWEYLYRSAFTGEWSFGNAVRPLVSALHLLGLYALALALIGIVRHFRQEARRSLPLLLTVLVLLGAFLYNRLSVPYACSQDFRFIAPAAVPLAYYAVRGALALPRRLRIVALVMLSALPLGSAAFLLALVFGM
ncbi:MAG: glycosyltransferase family 39 protein [Candidatus Peribacteraceae bacterium]|jgi:hypothetical protein